jgi:hypothetical protein
MSVAKVSEISSPIPTRSSPAPGAATSLVEPRRV